jgi:hypothetical protein
VQICPNGKNKAFLDISPLTGVVSPASLELSGLGRRLRGARHRPSQSPVKIERSDRNCDKLSGTHEDDDKKMRDKKMKKASGGMERQGNVG